MQTIHLTPADYATQPWKNGRGTTIELWRLEREGVLLARLSRASVVEDGPFSLFPGIERNLTVLTGRGFRLSGAGQDFRCDPLVPVAFAGDISLMATETADMPSDDFNVMTARALPRPEVAVVQGVALPPGGRLAIYALGACQVNGLAVAQGDLVLTEGPAVVQGEGSVIAVRFFGL